MKIHFDPLGKGRKKPDLEEALSIGGSGKEEKEENGRKMIMRFRLSKDAIAREAKPGYKAGNELIDKFNEESKEYEEKKEEIRIGHSPFFGLYFKDTAKEEEKARKKEEKARRREEEKAMRYKEQKKEKEEGEGDLYKKSTFEEYKQLYEQEIRKAFSEGNEYLRKGEKEKADEKYKEGWDLYNSLKTLDSEPALKSILQQEGGKKGLEEKLTEEKIEEEKAEEEEEKKEKKPQELVEDIAKKIKDRFSKKPAVTLYVDKGFFLNKWAGCFIPGAKMARENWRIQGRPGWRSKKWPFKDKVWFGQPGWYDEKPIDTRFTHYVYEKNYMEAKEGEKPEKKLVYKISDKMPEKVPKEIMEGGNEEEILDAQIMLNRGRGYYGELWKKDPRLGHKDWDIWPTIHEDFSREHTESIENMKNSYTNGKNGLICLDTTLGGRGKYTLVEQPKTGIYGLFKWGRLYNLKIGMGGDPTDTFFLNKHVVPSIFLGKRFALYDKFKFFGKRKLAAINKQGIKTWLHLGRPHYKIHIYDKELAKDENFKQILTLIVPYLEKEKQYHELRFKFEDKPGPYSTLASQNSVQQEGGR